MNNDYQQYKDIINLPHHISKKHPQMSMEERAAQFAPFAALTGYGDAIDETVRLTDKRIEIGDELKQVLNEKLQNIKYNIEKQPKVTFTYFIPDIKKQGGSYVRVTGNVKKIDKYIDAIILTNGGVIPITEIIEIAGDIFREID